jgi:glucosylceramidase
VKLLHRLGIGLSALMFTFTVGQLRAAGPSVTLTTSSEAWATQPLAPDNSAATNTPGVTVDVDPKQVFQTMDGFGGCFNELGWTALQTLPAETVQQVLKDLFDPSGANFNLCRMPIGANDYALDWYSLDDTAGDYALDHFSVARDEMFLMPYIHAAMAFQPGLRMWGSAWSPPIWLKTSGVYNGGTLKMDSQSLSTYAAYLSRYVQEYRKRGINVTAVHVQNEPFSKQTFPSCTMEASQFVEFIGKYLGPQFAKDKPGADIWLGTINGNSFPFMTQILDDKVAAPFIAGAGLQWGGREIVGAVHDRYPNLPLMQTESECGNGSDDWPAATHTWDLIHDYITHGVSSYIYWNMVLDETGLSTWGWKQNALVTVIRHAHRVRYNPEFYVMKHLSAFVRTQATRIGTGDSPDALAFRNPDGTVIVVVANFSGAAKTLHLKNGGKAYILPLPDISIATVQLPPGA